jgi:hypothetical protein
MQFGVVAEDGLAQDVAGVGGFGRFGFIPQLAQGGGSRVRFSSISSSRMTRMPKAQCSTSSRMMYCSCSAAPFIRPRRCSAKTG